MVQTVRRGRHAKKLQVAFYCWTKGYFEKTNSARLSELPDSDKLSDMEAVTTVYNPDRGEWGIRIPRNTLPGYATDDFYEAVSMWRDYQRFGFPEHGGMMDQGALWLDVVRLMSSCADRMGVA